MAAAWRNPNSGEQNLSLEDAAAQCHDFSDFIASIGMGIIINAL